MTQLKFVIVVLFAFIVAAFAVSNPMSVPIMLFRKEIIPSVSLVIVVLGSVLIGVILTALLGFFYQSRLKKEISFLKNENSLFKSKQDKLQIKIRELEDTLEENDIPLGETPPIEEKE